MAQSPQPNVNDDYARRFMPPERGVSSWRLRTQRLNPLTDRQIRRRPRRW